MKQIKNTTIINNDIESKKPILNNQVISRLIERKAPSELRVEFDQYLKFENFVRKHFEFQDPESTISELYLLALNTIKTLRINSKGCIRLLDFAEHFAPRCTGTERKCSNISKSKVAIIVLKSLGFNERFHGSGNFIYVKIRLSVVNDLSILLDKNEPICALLTFQKMQKWLEHIRSCGACGGNST